MKTFKIFSTFLILSLLGFLTKGVSQITCPFVDTTCTIINFDFSKYVNLKDSNFLLTVVPDSVCAWNYYANPIINGYGGVKIPDSEVYFECENFGAVHFLTIDPEFSGDSNQFYQELPNDIRTLGTYIFTMSFGIEETTKDYYRIYVCLTNDDPSHKCFPYSSQFILYDSWCDSCHQPVTGTHTISNQFPINQHYKYIVINYTLQVRNDDSFEELFQLTQVNLCLKDNPLQIDPGCDTTICRGDSISLGGVMKNCPDILYSTAWGGVPPYRYCWDTVRQLPLPHTCPWTVPYPTVKPSRTTTYYLGVEDSNNTIRIDSVTITVTPCSPWPRLIFVGPYGGEAPEVTCNSYGDVLASFLTSTSQLDLINDTTIEIPSGYVNEFILFDKHANRLWYNSLQGYYTPTYQQQLVDNQRNTYILFYSNIGYSFYNGHSFDSLNLNSGRQFLAKIDIHGNVNWVQSFSGTTNPNLIQSFCKNGDSLYLVGSRGNQGNISIGEGHLPPKNYPVSGDFICIIKNSNGDVSAVKSFTLNAADSGNYITSLHNDTILVINDGVFYLFDLSCTLIGYESVFLQPYHIHGWINNGIDKIVMNYPACAQNNHGYFTKLWAAPPNQDYPYYKQVPYFQSGFATSDFLYMGYQNDTGYFYFTQWDLATGNPLISPKLRPQFTGGFYIAGNKDLAFGYNISWIEADTIIIDTFGLPNGIPKSLAIISDTSTNKHIIDITLDQSITTFPNPAMDFITINLNDQFAEKINSVEIINSRGVKMKEINVNSTKEKYKIDLHDFPAGIYLIKVKSETQICIKKVIKMN
jgi:hypothetical protein